MNQELTQIFKNDKFGDLRVVLIGKDGKAQEDWFIGKDVADALGYSNSRDALARHVDDEDKTDVVIHDGSQNRNMVAINESGLYSLIFSSQLESAKQFKRWVTSEVLPSIRKHGAYLTREVTEKLKENPNYITDLISELEETSKQNDKLLHNYNDIRLMYQNTTNEVAEYANTQLKYSKSGKVKCNALYNHYCRWCRNTPHYEPYDRKQFEELLLERMVQGHSIKKDDNYYVGVGV